MRPYNEEITMDGHGKTILVAEAHESNRKWLALLLEHAQYEVHLATDGYAALDRMLNGVFDAVIMDWDIPRTERIEVSCPRSDPLARHFRHHGLGSYHRSW